MSESPHLTSHDKEAVRRYVRKGQTPKARKLTDDYKLYVAEEYANGIESVMRSKRVLDDEITSLREQAANLKSVGCDEKVDASAPIDGLESTVIKLQELIADVESKQGEYQEKYREMSRALESVPYPYSAALKYHYLLLMPWKEVAKKLSYSRSRIYKIREKGLLHLFDFVYHLNQASKHKAI